jgi:hypothetical protein
MANFNLNLYFQISLFNDVINFINLIIKLLFALRWLLCKLMTGI